MKKWCGQVVLMLVAVMLLSGCGNKEPAQPNAFITADNEIVSYKPVAIEKTVVTVGKYLAFDEQPIETFLEEAFPEVDMVFVESGAGAERIAYMALEGAAGKLPDLMFAARTVAENDFLYDLSAEGFSNRYNLSALSNISVDGKIYQLPLTNTVFGIAYNKTLFEEKGWTVPENLEAFYALCDTISAEGIRPLTTSYKYYRPIESLGFGFSFDDIFANLEGQHGYSAFLNGERSCEGLLEPMFMALRQLYDRGIIIDEDFSASATDRRLELYAGEVAMLPCNLDLLALYRQEQPDCEIDFMGFPTNTPGARWLHMIPGNKLSVSKTAMEDPDKKAVILAIVDKLSTDEGHEAMLQAFSGISSLTSYQQNMAFGFDEVDTCLREGRIFFADYYASNEYIPMFKDWITGKMTIEDMIAANDSAAPLDELALIKQPPIGTAEADFTILETSFYMADVMRQATGADIALLLNNYFYKGNVAQIFKGDITLPGRFVLKNIAGQDYLTTYKITGADLKALMEHPIINDDELDVMYAYSGLAMTYAPWAGMDNNVLSLTLADGTEIDDNATYTVAAWASSIDERYLSETLQVFPELGSCQTLMETAISAAGTIAPAEDGRITLDWSVR